MDNLKIEIAKTLAIAQSSQQVRDFLLRQARLEIPGEPSVLWMSVVDSTVHNGTPFYQWMATASLQTTTPRDSLFYRDTIFNLIPNLAFTFFVSYEGSHENIHDWEYSAPVLVTPATSLFESEEGYSVPAYDNQLQVTYISNQDDPEEAVIVIEEHPYAIPVYVDTKQPLNGLTLSQALNDGFPEGDMCQTLLDMYVSIMDQVALQIETIDPQPGSPVVHNIHTNILLLLTQATEALEVFYEECEDWVPGGWAGGGGGNVCERDFREYTEQVTRVQFHSKYAIRKFCKWTRKDCTIHILPVFVAAENNNALPVIQFEKAIILPRKAAMSLLPYSLPFSPQRPTLGKLYKWRYLDGVHGDWMHYSILGKHPKEGQEVTHKVPFSTKVGFKEPSSGTTVELSFGYELTVKYTKKDFNLLGFEVDYCDEADGFGKQYGTGYLDIWIREAYD
jgi:hypothetical protein